MLICWRRSSRQWAGANYEFPNSESIPKSEFRRSRRTGRKFGHLSFGIDSGIRIFGIRYFAQGSPCLLELPYNIVGSAMYTAPSILRRLLSRRIRVWVKEGWWVVPSLGPAPLWGGLSRT